MKKNTRDGSTTSAITNTLRDEIISGALAPGQRLDQQALADRFTASRMPVRESLQHLAAEGLVTWVAGRSVRVAPLDPNELREVSEMRMVGESLALRLAIGEMSNRDLAAAEALQDAAESAEAAQFTDLNTAFHQSLLTPCQRPRLLAHITELERISQRYLMVAVNSLDYSQQSHAEHRAILDACRARDASLACRLLEHHITAASLALLSQIEQFTPPQAG